MPKANPIFTNFSAGEWSARNEGRVELENYYRSCRTLENFIVASQGGADFRPGTAYVTTGKTDALKIRLIPFSIKDVGEYIVELGNLYARFIKCSTHSYIAGSETVTPWVTADLFDIKYAQSKTALYLVHPSYAPTVLTRTNDTTWVLTKPTFSGWDESTKKYITNITQAAPPVVTSVGHTYLTNDIVYIVGVFGMSELNAQAYKITKINDDTYSLNNVDTTLYNPYVSGGTSRKAANIFGTADNYPSAVGFYQQRVVLGGTNNIPDGVWFSEPGEFLNFKMPEGLYFKVSHQKGLAIQWLAGKGELVFGADTCEGIIRGGPLIYNNFDLRVESVHGSHNIQGQMIGDHILFVQVGGRRIREFAYHDASGGWESFDLTHYADHITGTGVTEIVVQTNPDTIFWAVRSDGTLAVLVYEHLFGIVAWSKVIIANEDDAEVESIACVRGTEEDEIYLSVKRTVNGTTKRFIEYFKPRYFGTDQADAYFVDCGITWDGGDAETITDITQTDPPVVTIATHGFDDGDMVRLADVVESDEGLLDCSTFVEVDPGADITLAANSVTVVELDRDLHSLVYKQLGHEFLDDAFTYTFQMNLVAFETSGRSMLPTWGVADVQNTMHSLIDGDGNALSLIIRKESVTDHLHFQIWEIYGGEAQVKSLDTEFALATDYYITVTRTIVGGDNDCGTLTVSVYSDATRLVLIESQTISLNTIVKYTYLYAIQNYEDISGAGFGWDDYTSVTITDLSGPANRSSYNQVVFTVDDDDAANTFTLDDEDDVDINGFEFKQYVSGGTAQKVIKDVTGLTHLEGESVAILADGATHPNKTVSVGSVTLDRYANKVHVGLGYSSQLKPQRPEGGGSYGSAQGKTKRVHKLVIRVYKSSCGKIGSSEDNLQSIIPETPTMDIPSALYTGDIEILFPGEWGKDADILIVQDKPLPLNILAIMPEMITND